MYLAGLRIAEVCDLRPGDLFLDGEFPHLRVRHGKGDRARNVPVGPTLRRRLVGWAQLRRRDSEWFFHTGKGGRVHETYVRQFIKRLIDRVPDDLGVPYHVSPHTFRHCHAVEALERGHTLREVQALLGHRSVQSTVVYLDARARAMARGDGNHDPDSGDA